jgi:hypothetical protein
MTQADVDLVMSAAAIRGIHVDEDEARMFLGAKGILAADPSNKLARQVIEESTRLLTTGQRPTTFARFMLPIFYTEEEIAENERLDAEHRAYLKGQSVDAA